MPRIWLKCCVNGKSVRAIADTGADDDFMSESFAISQGFNIEPRTGLLAYADDSTGGICGVLTAKVVVGTDVPTYEPAKATWRQTDDSVNVTVSNYTNFVSEEDKGYRREEIDYRRVVESVFYVVKELRRDVIIGEKSLRILQPFRFNQDEFELGPVNEGVAYFNRISEVRISNRIVETGVSTVVNIGREIGRVFALSSRYNSQDIEGRFNVRQLRVFQLTQL